jgi:hypothetical protein
MCRPAPAHPALANIATQLAAAVHFIGGHECGAQVPRGVRTFQQVSAEDSHRRVTPTLDLIERYHASAAWMTPGGTGATRTPMRGNFER